MPKQVIDDEIVYNPSDESEKRKRNSSSDAEDNEKSPADDLDEEMNDNPLDAVAIAQLGEMEQRINSQFAALITRFEGIEGQITELQTRLEDRCRELHDRIALSSLPPGEPAEQTRMLMHTMQLVQLDSRRMANELAELKRASAPAATQTSNEIAALVSAAVSEATKELNKQVVALHDQLRATAKKEEPPEPPPVKPITEAETGDKSAPRRRHKWI